MHLHVNICDFAFQSGPKGANFPRGELRYVRVPQTWSTRWKHSAPREKSCAKLLDQQASYPYCIPSRAAPVQSAAHFGLQCIADSKVLARWAHPNAAARATEITLDLVALESLSLLGDQRLRL